MKRTPEDTTFAFEFGRELKARYDSAKRQGLSDEDFAKSIGVVRAQLDRYLRGEAVPGIRTVALAYRKYGIATPYGQTPAAAPLTGRKRRRKGTDNQLELPFTVWAEGPGIAELKLKPVSARKFALLLTIKRAQ
jgi:transcriptional regulator with XRE-family HTH domain